VLKDSENVSRYHYIAGEEGGGGSFLHACFIICIPYMCMSAFCVASYTRDYICFRMSD
jgi:hypothetical protein